MRRTALSIASVAILFASSASGQTASLQLEQAKARIAQLEAEVAKLSARLEELDQQQKKEERARRDPERIAEFVLTQLNPVSSWISNSESLSKKSDDELRRIYDNPAADFLRLREGQLILTRWYARNEGTEIDGVKYSDPTGLREYTVALSALNPHRVEIGKDNKTIELHTTDGKRVVTRSSFDVFGTTGHNMKMSVDRRPVRRYPLDKLRDVTIPVPADVNSAQLKLALSALIKTHGGVDDLFPIPE